MTDLIKTENVMDVLTGDALDQILKKYREEYMNFVGSVENAQSRKQIGSKAYEVSQEKVRIDNLGKSLVEDWKTKSKVVDAARKKVRDYLDQLRDDVRKPLTEWKEAEEKQRAEADKRRIEDAAARTKENHAKKHREALDDFMKNGIDEAVAKNIITIIVKGKISHISIKY